MDEADPLTLGVVRQQAEAVATRVDARLVEHSMIGSTTAPIAKLSQLTDLIPAGDDDERDFLTRLSGVPEYLTKAAQRHRAGLAAGRLPVESLIRVAIAKLDANLADPAGDPLRRPPVTGHRVAERDRLLADLVRPAFAGYREVLATELAGRGRSAERPGLCWLPGGDTTYPALVRLHTTTERTAEELHRTGLELIEQLGEEYLKIGGAVFGLGTVAEVHTRMRTDPALRFGSAQEMLDSARAAMDRAWTAGPEWLGLPERICGLAPVPSERAASASSASYAPGPLDGSKPGEYHVNTHRATERDRCVAEANTFHETVPGHHVQITLAQGMTGVPLLRRVAWVNSYMEGWALYSERLADEMGLYSDDLARLGMLANDSMRAARLVVDTGLHHFGWSRQRVVEYLRANTVMSEVEIQSETDRYIEDPGQALSYMVGRLEIQRLREFAERGMGTSFDLRSFHDLVLGTGPVPMAVLDDVVGRFVKG